MNKLTKQQWIEVKNQIDEGKPIAHIAKENDISRTAIYLYGGRNWGWKEGKLTKFLQRLIFGR
jgi:hypothetical protein